MKSVFKIATGIVLLIVVLFSCKQLYSPALVSKNTNYLVVEGIINTSGDSTIIKLSRTVPLTSKLATKAETKAKITIESDANTTVYHLVEIKAGIYASIPLSLNKTAKYRLKIVTSDNKTYASDFVPVKEAPPIDNLGYKVQPNGLQIYADAHDDTKNTRYYRWDFVETYKFNAAYNSSEIAVNANRSFRPRTPDELIYTCWRSEVANNIVLASTAKLTQDVVYNGIITTVPSQSEKVKLGYSILLKQYALTEEAFNYWENIKKNTESLGSIFDAQPSEINGNIHNINDVNETVLGYVSAGTTQQKRLTVLNTSWPATWGYGESPYSTCGLDTIFFSPLGSVSDMDVFFGNPPTQYQLGEAFLNGFRVGYLGSGRTCVDCTLRGTIKKPSYWPN